MLDDILTLIAENRGVDEFGDPVITETRREVYCSCESIGQKEFYQAHAVGLQPECKFRIADYLDYENEPYIEYYGVRYKVLRTYRTGLEIELTCYREVNNL